MKRQRKDDVECEFISRFQAQDLGSFREFADLLKSGKEDAIGSGVLPVLSSLLSTATSSDVINSASGVVSLLASRSALSCAMVLETDGLFPLLVSLFCKTDSYYIGVMWSLSSLVSSDKTLGKRLICRSDFVTSLKHFLSCTSRGKVIAPAVWLLNGLASSSGECKKFLLEDGQFLSSLAEILRQQGDVMVKRMAALTTRIIIYNSPQGRRTAHSLGMVESLGKLLSCFNRNVAVAAASTLDMICVDHQIAKDSVRDYGLLKLLVDLLDCPALSVQQTAVQALLTCMVDNAKNQDAVCENGILKKLAFLVHLHRSSVHVGCFIDALAQVLIGRESLALELSEEESIVEDICVLLSQRGRIQCVAACVLRSLVCKKTSLAVLFVSYGAIAKLCTVDWKLLTTNGKRNILAALASIFLSHPESCAMACALGSSLEDTLVSVITSKIQTAESSTLLLSVAVACLRLITKHVAGVADRVALNPVLVQRITCLADTSFGSAFVVPQANELLKRLISPEQYALRQSSVRRALLDSLPEHTHAVHACCVCMTDDPTIPKVFLPCIHAFHKSCINAWLERGKDVCPMCKFPVLGSIQSIMYDS